MVVIHIVHRTCPAREWSRRRAGPGGSGCGAV